MKSYGLAALAPLAIANPSPLRVLQVPQVDGAGIPRLSLRQTFRSNSLQPPSPKSAKKSQQIGEQIGGPFFRQNRLPVPWISVPDP